MDFKKLREILPEEDQAELDALEDLKNLDSQPLLLCVAGAFSTGKTSLINRMLEKELLPVALEESTALPTFLEFAPTPAYNLVLEEGVRHIEADQIDEVIKNPPAGAKFLDVGLPVNWLAGLRLVDLPGTGGTDKIKAEYARQQMRNADAIIYLLHPRGPTRQDLENIKLLRALSKKVLLCVSQWDMVQESAKKGEKIPDLQAWQKEIAYNTGLDAKIIPLDKTGLGLPEIFSFLVNSITSLAELRDNRIYAELAPILANKLEEKKRTLEILQAAGEEETQKLQQKLLAEKEQLLQLKNQAFAERQGAISEIMNKWQTTIEELQKKLGEQLAELADTLQSPEDYDKFLNEGRDCLNSGLVQAARHGRDLSEEYGQLQMDFTLPENDKFVLPKPPALEVSDFLDSGRFSALHDELLALKEHEKQLETQETIPNSGVSRDEILEKIRQMESVRQEIINQPLPMRMVEQPETGGSGKALGRMLGEMADLALIFFLPATLASKTASVASKTAKSLGVGAKAAKKIASVTRQTVKGAQMAHKAANGEKVLAPPILEKLDILDKFTLGYWGERLGEALDGPSEPEQIIDQDALNERNADLAKMETELQKMRLELLSMPAQTNNTGLRNELLERIAQKERQLERMQKEAADCRNAAEQKAREEYQKKFFFARQRAMTQWLRSFEKQTGGMGKLLHELLKNWWEDRIPELLESQEKSVNGLFAKLQEDQAEKRRQAEKVQEAITQLEEMLEDVLRKTQAES